MRVFITGGTGYVGSHLVHELASAGHQLALLTRNVERAKPLQLQYGVTVVEGDLREVEAVLPHLTGHDACIHNGIIWEDARTEIDAKDIRASIHLFEAAAEAGIQSLIYTSSTAVHRPFLNTPMDEAQRIETADLYGATKASAEHFLWAVSHESKMRCNVVRPGPVIGAPAYDGGPFRLDRRFAAIIERARSGEDIEVAQGDGRQFIAAADLARVYRQLLESDRAGEIYLAVAEDLITWEEVARSVAALANSRSRLVVGAPEKPPRFETRKLSTHFGLSFQARPSLEEHLRHAVESR